MSLIAIPAITAGRRQRLDPLVWLAAGKITIACLLASSFVVPAAGGFHGQALWLRGVVYPVGLIVLPLISTARGRGRYPLAADAYLLVPFAFDAAGNSLGLYGRIDNFDNLSHLVGTVALTGSKARCSTPEAPIASSRSWPRRAWRPSSASASSWPSGRPSRTPSPPATARTATLSATSAWTWPERRLAQSRDG
jgi:hypothetical protein